MSTAQQEMDEMELGGRVSHELYFGQDVRWVLRVARLVRLGKALG